MKQLTPGKKAIVLYCALVITSGAVALAFMGPVLASAAIIGSMAFAGLIATFVWVRSLNKEWKDNAYSSQP